MIYTDLTKITFPFLHDAIFIILCRGHKLRNVYMDPNGEVNLSFNEILNEEAIKDVLIQLIPTDIGYDDFDIEYNVDFSFSEDGKQTYIYSPEGIDYRKL